MDKTERLGNNIRCLRMAYGETQEQLGYAIGVEKNTISSYETNRTQPKKEILSSIAAHYMISVEELLTYDFSGTDKVILNQNEFWEQIDIILPVTSSENAKKNEHFRKAYSFHRKLFDELQERKLDNIDNAMICFEEYIEAFDDENSIEEAAANFIGLWYLFTIMVKLVPKIMIEQPAVLQQLELKDSKIRRILEDLAPNFRKDTDDLLSDLNDPEFNEMQFDLMKKLKKSGEWHELGDYYAALRFILNLVDNGMGWEFNRRVGIEMLSSFASVGNPYAIYFLSPDKTEIHKL